MIKVHVKFNGRLLNAIGIFYDIEDIIFVENTDKNTLLIELYKKYEHITQLTWKVE